MVSRNHCPYNEKVHVGLKELAAGTGKAGTTVCASWWMEGQIDGLPVADIGLVGVRACAVHRRCTTQTG